MSGECTDGRAFTVYTNNLHVALSYRFNSIPSDDADAVTLTIIFWLKLLCNLNNKFLIYIYFQV